MPGYEGCKLTLMNQRPVAFASFQTREFASSAIQQLEGIKFDPEVDYSLRVEFARANSKVFLLENCELYFSISFLCVLLWKVKRIISDPGNQQVQQQEKRRRVASPYPPSYGHGHSYNYAGYDNYSSYPPYSEPYSSSSHPANMYDSFLLLNLFIYNYNCVFSRVATYFLSID